MAIARISPKSANYPYLKEGGIYGVGHAHEAEVELTKYVAQVEVGDGPGWDRKCEQGNYCKFTFTIQHEVFGRVTLNDWQSIEPDSGSKAFGYLVNLGVNIDRETGEHDEAQVAPRNCAIEVGDPKESNGRIYNGRVLQVLGA